MIKTRNIPTKVGSGVNNYQKNNEQTCCRVTSSETWPEWRHKSFAGWFHPGTSASRSGPGPRERCWPDGSANGAADPEAVDGPAGAAAAAVAVVRLSAGVDRSHRNWPSSAGEATG